VMFCSILLILEGGSLLYLKKLKFFVKHSTNLKTNSTDSFVSLVDESEEQKLATTATNLEWSLGHTRSATSFQ
jgi:tRNA A37 N6-isopentenylltransferase MiaA